MKVLLFYHSVLFVKKYFEIFDETCINFYWTKMAAVNISHHTYLLIPEYCSITNSLIMCIHFCKKYLSYFVNKYMCIHFRKKYLSYFVNKYHLSIFDKTCINLSLVDENGSWQNFTPYITICLSIIIYM
jgi:hypothetical protein